MRRIYDQFMRLLKRPEKRPDRNPMPAAPLTDGFRDYVADGLTPERLAELLKEADAGEISRQAELFDQIEERDGHITGDMSKRRNVILDADFVLEPASDDKRDQAVAEAVNEYLDGITNWPDILVSLQDAVGKGYAPIELHWDYSEGQVWVDKFEFIEQKRFRFTDGSGILSRVPLLITDEDPLGIDIPPFKVMMHRYGGMSGHVVRAGIYRICAWWYLFKNYSVKDWVIFCEVYGMPLRLGKYDPGASKEDKEALAIAVQALGTDAAGIISKATEIEFLTGMSGSVSGDLYQGLAGFANKEMSKAILGGTLTSDVDGRGSYAAANTHNDVRHDLINADARALAGTIRDQLIRPWVGFNYGWDVPVPKYRGSFKKFNPEEHAELLDKFADRMDIPVSHVREKFNIPAPEKDEECLRAKIAPKNEIEASMVHVAAKQPNEPENEEMDFTGMISEQIGEASDTSIAAMLEPVKEILAGAESLEEFRDALVRAWPDMDTAALGSVIERAMLASELGGRYEASNG